MRARELQSGVQHRGERVNSRAFEKSSPAGESRAQERARRKMEKSRGVPSDFSFALFPLHLRLHKKNSERHPRVALLRPSFALFSASSREMTTRK